MKLHHVQLAIAPSGEDVARAFYKDVIGLAEREKPPILSSEGVWFGDRTFELHLGVEEEFRPARKCESLYMAERRVPKGRISSNRQEDQHSSI